MPLGKTAEGTRIDWNNVRRVLVVRLRSIGDTVLATPSLVALKRFLPHAEVDILLEDWVAPLLDGFDAVDNVLRVGHGFAARARAARKIRRNRYDVVFNLHGGTTAAILTYASGGSHRVGYADYRYSLLYNHRVPSSSDFWQKEKTHSAEQQLAILGGVGVPVWDKPRSRLVVTESAVNSLEKKLHAKTQRSQSQAEKVRTPCVSGWSELGNFVLMHPTAAFATKQWATENFARVAEYLYDRGLKTVAVGAGDETAVLEMLAEESRAPVTTFNDLSLPEITALASRARLFVGNDSGIAHIAAAVNTPSVVIFGSSNIHHWRPWTDAANEIVYEKLPCQPCPGYICAEFGAPKCILSVSTASVFEAIDRILKQSEKADAKARLN